MMGRQTNDQAQLFYLFNLAGRIPSGHLLRRINPIVTGVLADLREKLAGFYSDIGRPSIDPELMIRMLIVGYCYGIRSERQLCEEVTLHLAYRWFCRLDLDDQVPHHSTFSVNRLGRFRASDILRHVFERAVAACMAAGLVNGEGFAVDASVIEANASRYHCKSPEDLDWTDAQRQKRAVAEYLTALDVVAPTKIEVDDADGEPKGGPRKVPKCISLSDPQSAWTAKANKRVLFGYGLNYLIDIKHAIIVDVEATPARTYDEVAATKTMIDRTERRFDLKPKQLVADTAYGTGRLLAWLVKEKRITPHIPVWDKSERDDGTFSRSRFTFDKRNDLYHCPAGKKLTTTGHVHDNHTIHYRASVPDCRTCGLKLECCPNVPARRLMRDVDEDARDVARRKMKTKAFFRSRNLRKKVEMRFAHLKTHHRFERLRLRGLPGARDEFHLAATIQNLKTLALRLSTSTPMNM
jgi:transposase